MLKLGVSSETASLLVASGYTAIEEIAELERVPGFEQEMIATLRTSAKRYLDVVAFARNTDGGAS